MQFPQFAFLKACITGASSESVVSQGKNWETSESSSSTLQICFSIQPRPYISSILLFHYVSWVIRKGFHEHKGASFGGCLAILETVVTITIQTKARESTGEHHHTQKSNQLFPSMIQRNHWSTPLNKFTHDLTIIRQYMYWILDLARTWIMI